MSAKNAKNAKNAVVTVVVAAAAAFALGLGGPPWLPRAQGREGERTSVRAVAHAAPAGGRDGFQVVDVEGLRGLLRKGHGHVVLLHFWASWCYPCLQELPLVDRFAREMKPRGLEVLSMSLDDPARMGTRVGALLRKAAPNLTPNIARFGDADDLIATVDPRWAGAIPALFAYDHRGQLRGNLIGAASRAELDALVGGLLLEAAAKGAGPPALSAPVPAPAPASAIKAKN